MNGKKGLPLLLILAALIALCTGCAATQKNIDKEKEAGIAAMAKEDYEGAIRHFDKSIELAGGKINRQVVDTCYYKAAAQYNLGNTDETVKQYTSIMKYDETNPEPCFLRGSVYLQQEDKDKALRDYDNAISRDASNYRMYILIFRNLAAHGYREEAEEYLERALDVKGNKKENYLGRASIYLEQKDYDNARKQLEKLGDKLSDEAMALRGDVELATGNYEKALAYYEKGLEKQHSEGKDALLKGEISALEHLGRFDEAKKKLDEYLKLYPADADAQREQIFLGTR